MGLESGVQPDIGGDADAVSACVQSSRPWHRAGPRLGRVGPAGSATSPDDPHGIEYGMMQPLPRIFHPRTQKEFDWTAPDRRIWRHGSVVRSWLLCLTAEALDENPTLDGIAPFVPILAKAAGPCRGDRPQRAGAGDHSFADRALALARHEFVSPQVLSMMRNGFGWAMR